MCVAYADPVLWFAVWSVLVVGTLVGGFFLVRDLWRRTKALFAALEELTDVLDRLDRQAAALADQVGTVPRPVELGDPGPARGRVLEARVVRAGRARRRADRHEAAYRRWWTLVR